MNKPPGTCAPPDRNPDEAERTWHHSLRRSTIDAGAYLAGVGGLGWFSPPSRFGFGARRRPVTPAEGYDANTLRPRLPSSRPMPTIVPKTTIPRRSITSASSSCGWYGRAEIARLRTARGQVRSSGDVRGDLGGRHHPSWARGSTHHHRCFGYVSRATLEQDPFELVPGNLAADHAFANLDHLGPNRTTCVPPKTMPM